MQLEAHQTRSTAEITELIDDLTTEYLRGGPKRDYFLDGCGFVHNGNWDPDEAYHLIVWALAQGDDEDTLERALVWGHIETSGGLRDLLRLVGSRAAAAALSWVLERQLPTEIGFGPAEEDRALDRSDVLREARGLLPDKAL